MLEEEEAEERALDVAMEIDRIRALEVRGWTAGTFCHELCLAGQPLLVGMGLRPGRPSMCCEPPPALCACSGGWEPGKPGACSEEAKQSSLRARRSDRERGERGLLEVTYNCAPVALGGAFGACAHVSLPPCCRQAWCAVCKRYAQGLL